ncbi:MAG: phosphoribosylformylglycinamidine synthase subunit PurL, partial [Deltaproteobacteria bacterium]|nr:phosphoribosylformylglycinamidine synthase subunit PurL [Deltaproteobacteria bacterium]
KMGIPTVAGAVFFHPHYTTNPLVFCGTVGILPRDGHPTHIEAGDLVVVLGGRTGRDGLRGATFSSLAMDEETTRVSGGAVQIGHPIAEKQVMEVMLRARDAGLYHAVTDCGAGGLSSAVGEMGKDLGAVVELARVPLKYPGLDPWEIWLSEAQERMVLAVPAAAMPQLEALARDHASEVTAIGTFGGGRVRVTFEGTVVGDLDPAFLHDGIPRRHLKASWVAPAAKAPEEAVDESADAPGAIAAGLVGRLASANLGSRRAIVRRYDHEVGGGTVVRPLVGPGEGPSDAAVVVPREVRAAWLEDGASGPLAGVAIGVGMDPELGLRDPYVMAWAAVDEAVRNVVAVGADPDAIAILDNFSWGDPRLPDRLGALVRCTRGCHDAALHYGTPFVSGKDSLNNEWTDADGRRHAIPPTLVITALGRVPDARRTVTSALRSAGDVVYALGVTLDAWAGLPDREAPGRYRALYGAIAAGLVTSCHDVGGSGLAGALAEMAIGGRLGVEVVMARAPGAATLRPGRRAFATSPGRHLVTVAAAQVAAFEAAMEGHVWARLGEVTAQPLVALGDTTTTLADLEAAFATEAASPF